MLRYLYSDGRLRTGMGSLVLPLAGKLHHLPDWKRGSAPPLRDLALATHTQSCAPGGLLHAPLCSRLLFWMKKQPAEREEESRVILPWPLISMTGEGDHLCIRLCKEPRVTRASMQGQPGDYTETQGCCLLIFSLPFCTFPFSIFSPLPASHRETAPSLVWGNLPRG